MGEKGATEIKLGGGIVAKVPSGVVLTSTDAQVVREMYDAYDAGSSIAIKIAAKKIGKKLKEKSPEGWGVNSKYPFDNNK